MVSVVHITEGQHKKAIAGLLCSRRKYNYSCLVFCVIQTYSECGSFFYCHSERSEGSRWPEDHFMAL